MLGSPEQPWIDTDPFIDLAALKAIELDIVKGICLSDLGMASYGPTMLDPLGRQDYLVARRQITQLPAEHPHRRLFDELETHTKHDAFALARATRIFAKIYYNIYSGGPSIPLRTSRLYADKNKADRCVETKNAVLFPSLFDYVHTRLPFSEVGRIVIFLNDHDLVTPIHSDDVPVKWHQNEFLWLRPNLAKKFFIYDRTSGAKHYVTSHSAFFNEQCWHGTDPSPNMTFSIRIDGFFTQAFREQLGIHHLNNYQD